MRIQRIAFLSLFCATLVSAQSTSFKTGIDPVLLKKAEAGNSNAQFQVGRAYEAGRQVVRDPAKAAEWYTKSAEQGDPRAQSNLGVLYEYGIGVAKDYSKAVELYRKSADQGFAASQFSLGLCYIHGRGVSQDYHQGISWYEKAATQDNTDAILNLALLYINGTGVRKDEKRGNALIRRAAELGSSDAQLQVGMDYEDGVHGSPKNQPLAIEWLRKAAENGNVAAQFNLAMLLSSKPDEMYFWLGLVTPHLEGDALQKAHEIRTTAAALLTPEQRGNIDRRVSQWQAMHEIEQ